MGNRVSPESIPISNIRTSVRVDLTGYRYKFKSGSGIDFLTRTGTEEKLKFIKAMIEKLDAVKPATSTDPNKP